MRQRNALWRTGRSRGIHDTAKVLRRRRDRVNQVLLSRFLQVLNADDVEVVEIGLKLVQILLLGLLVGIVDNMLDRLDIAEDVVKRGNQSGIEEYGNTGGLLKRMLQSFFTQGIISGDDRNRLRRSTVRHGQPVCTTQLASSLYILGPYNELKLTW